MRCEIAYEMAKRLVSNSWAWGLLCALVVVQSLHSSVAGGSASVADKIRQLKDQSAKSFVLKLSNAKFREYVKSPLRNYSFVVLFAAMASHRMCNICKTVREEFELTAKAFRLSQGTEISDQLFFGFVDFDNNEETFRSMNVNSVPLLVFFPARRKIQLKSDLMDMQRYGYTAESMAKWLLEKSGLEIRIVRPPVFFGTAGLLILFFVGSIVIYFRCENFSVFSNRTIWGIVAVGFCLLMTSGQMWNHIRCPPFLTRTPNGDFGYVHLSSHSQFIGETYGIFLLNAGITVSVIVLIDTNYPPGSSRKNKILPLVCTLLAAFFFNALLAVFRTKASNYPYRGFF